MPIRLSKACKDLNVGMSTAVEFLAKKGHKLSADPNLKLEDELYLLLAKEFNKDMALKIESERISKERQEKEKAETVGLKSMSIPKRHPNLSKQYQLLSLKNKSLISSLLDTSIWKKQKEKRKQKKKKKRK